MVVAETAETAETEKAEKEEKEGEEEGKRKNFTVPSLTEEKMK